MFLGYILYTEISFFYVRILTHRRILCIYVSDGCVDKMSCHRMLYIHSEKFCVHKFDFLHIVYIFLVVVCVHINYLHHILCRWSAFFHVRIFHTHRTLYIFVLCVYAHRFDSHRIRHIPEDFSNVDTSISYHSISRFSRYTHILYQQFCLLSTSATVVQFPFYKVTGDFYSIIFTK